MYNKLPIALGAALAVGVAGFAGGAMAKVEGDTIIIGSSLSLTGNIRPTVFTRKKVMISRLSESMTPVVLRLVAKATK